jgi:hypothetical protein
MLRWMCGHTRKYQIRNEVIRERVGVAPIEEKLVQRRPPEAPIYSGILRGFDNAKRGREQPKLTWEEAVKRDMKDWNVPRDLVFDRVAWKSAIHVPEP